MTLTFLYSLLSAKELINWVGGVFEHRKQEMEKSNSGVLAGGHGMGNFQKVCSSKYYLKKHYLYQLI